MRGATALPADPVHPADLRADLRANAAVLSGGEVLADYLHGRAGDFLRGLRLYGESGADTEAAAEAARSLRGAARRIGGTLHTYRPLLDAGWADQFRTELMWLSGTLAQEHACAARASRLLGALARLSGAVPQPRTTGAPTPTGTAAAPNPPAAGPDRTLTMGASRAAALLERQLTLARTRAHSATLQALGSSRFHAVADAVAVLASEVPLTAAAEAPAGEVLAGPAEAAERRLREAVTTLPLARAAHPYNADALIHGLAAAAAGEAQDAPWHQVRHLLRLHRYAEEVRSAGSLPDPAPIAAGRTLDHHRDAAEAAAAAANAARTPRIAPATAYALGVLHADQRHEVEAARFAFQQVWQKATVTTR
ncbi:CHAD domain-containing protein [Streptomyces paludis]|uniref:CHAD domain-containing protein n=1 Tax=Streptomyces paludis TaxID=2282738 RepID=A0A345I0W6_9ACTN|nr:CHAD domain-containing protein [Streptomyces paludis]AXG82590.1 CHAD domain-containing protein [Streptomyces paludis]